MNYLRGIIALTAFTCCAQFFTACDDDVRYEKENLGKINLDKEDKTINGYSYVDLGLTRKDIYGKCDNSDKKVVIATVNLGADNDTDFGYYFRWGELCGWQVSSFGEAKNDSCWEIGTINQRVPETKKFARELYDNSNTFFATCDYATLLSGMIVDQVYFRRGIGYYGDAATYNWGKGWMMMSAQLLSQLFEQGYGDITVGSVNLNVSWVEDYKSNHAGVVVKNTETGNELFFPVGGTLLEKYIYNPEKAAYYWSGVENKCAKLTKEESLVNTYVTYGGRSIRAMAEID